MSRGAHHSETGRPRVPSWLALIVVTLGFVVWLSTWTSPGQGAVLGPLLFVVLDGGVIAAAWLAAAFGLGVIVRDGVLRPAHLEGRSGWERTALAAALGIAALLCLDALLGTLGLLGPVGAWVVVIAALVPVALRLRPTAEHAPNPADTWALAWTAAPAIAVLVVAASQAPSWLWRSEFGGYDALSYHLQLPREWFEAGGRITPGEHNVYGFLPGYVEAAYLHLMSMRGDPFAASLAAQWLHAAMAFLTAVLTGLAVARATGRASLAGAAFTLTLGVPWLVITGSLAYNECAVALMLAAGALLLVRTPAAADAPIREARPLDAIDRVRLGAVVGLLGAAALGAKLTAIGFACLPLALFLARRCGARGWRDAAPTAIATGLLLMTPWLVRNGIATGNPVFPFASGLFGGGHWLPEQFERFSAAHSSPDGLGARFGLLVQEFLRYGIGDPPLAPGAVGTSEPWSPQWSLLPWLALGGIAFGIAQRDRRRLALDVALVTAVQIAFWLAATHLKSRFLVPAIPTLVIGAMLLLDTIAASVRSSGSRGAARVAASIALFLWALAPLAILRSERVLDPRVIDQAGTVADATPIAASRTGAAGLDLVLGDVVRRELARQTLDAGVRAQLRRLGGPAFTLAAELDDDARVLAIGESAPFLYHRPPVYATVWDRGPLEPFFEDLDEAPAATISRLRGAGYSHVLIDERMLSIWARSGYLDPALSLDRLGRIVRASTIVGVWPERGTVLILLP